MSYLAAVVQIVVEFVATHRFIAAWVVVGVLGCWYTSTSRNSSGGNS
jgi:hypothetical protein